MKKILAVSVMVILAVGTIAPVLQDAYGLQATKQSGPKAFGEKTKGKFLSDSQKTHNNGFDGMKKEEIKTFKKMFADYKAQEIFKKLYRLG